MQLLNYWPENNTLALPKLVSKAFINHLIEPFEDEHSAKDFWHEYPSTIIIIEPNDPKSLLTLTGESIKNLIDFGLEYPEYSDSLSEGYQVNLAVVNDEGNGVYIVFNSELNQMLKEVVDD